LRLTFFSQLAFAVNSRFYFKCLGMVADLIRDTTFGQIIRLVTKNRWPQYPEEKDPESWKKLVNDDKLRNFAHHETTECPVSDDDQTELDDARKVWTGDEENDSGQWRDSTQTFNDASGISVDLENGRHTYVVNWYGPNDPEVSKRWAS
jgi:MFS transporter, DHA1 family, multidrug resistance protein